MWLDVALRRLVAVLCFVALSQLCSEVQADRCVVQSNPTRCNLSDGSSRYLDLTNISFPDFPSQDGQFTYAFDPSGTGLNNGGTCSPGNQAAACQLAGDWYTLGLASQVSVDVQASANPVTSKWSYSGGDSGRSFVVTVTCGEGFPGRISDDGEYPQLVFNFAVTSQDGCLKGGQPPRKIEKCVLNQDIVNHCHIEDGRYLNIKSIAHSFLNITIPGYKFSYGPLGDLNIADRCIPQNKPAVCQTTTDSTYVLGTVSPISVEVDTTDGSPVTSTWRYEGGDESRSAVVVITCDPTQHPGSVHFTKEEPELTYNFAITSAAGCLHTRNTTTITPTPTPHATTENPRAVTCVLTEGSNSTQCKLPDGWFLDISSIANAFAKFPSANPADKSSFTYAPMGDMALGSTCTQRFRAAMCKESGGGFYSLGASNFLDVKVDFTAMPVKSTWTYTRGESERISVVVIVCDPSQSPGSISDRGEDPELTYNFLIESVAGCLRSAKETATRIDNVV